MTWLGTNNGKRIDLLDPRADQIDLDDIACGLHHVPRFMGQTYRHYSVLSHSMNVASLVPAEYKLCALLHDAAEAYIGDVPTPLKLMLGDTYRDVEHKIAKAIATHFGLTKHSLTHLPSVVKEADQIMLITEHHLLQKSPADWEWDKDMLRLPHLPHDMSTVHEFKAAVAAAQEYHK